MAPSLQECSTGWLVGLAVAFGLAGCTAGCMEIRIPDPDVRYIAFGDSTTAGPSTRDYPDILRETLGEPENSFANEGKGGETTDEGLERLNMLLEDELFPEATDLLYWEGGNDITDFIQAHDPFLLSSPDDPGYVFADVLNQRLDVIQANMTSAVIAAKNDGLRVHVATYFFLIEGLAFCQALPFDIVFPFQAANANVYIRRLNQRIRTVAADPGAILVDVAAVDATLRGDPANYFNCNHLSEEGNAIAAEVFRAAIESASP